MGTKTRPFSLLDDTPIQGLTPQSRPQNPSPSREATTQSIQKWGHASPADHPGVDATWEGTVPQREPVKKGHQKGQTGLQTQAHVAAS